MGSSINRKGPSPTQPGRGIRKIVDLFHELSDLADKAGKYCASETAPEMDSIDSQDFEGLTEDAINKERQEYIIYTCDLGMTDDVTETSAVGVVTWP
jgi:hypothetical protein